MDIEHTPLDAAALIAAGVPLDSTQPRERSVPCLWCRTPTLNQMAGCDEHWQEPGAVRRASTPAPGSFTMGDKPGR